MRPFGYVVSLHLIVSQPPSERIPTCCRTPCQPLCRRRIANLGQPCARIAKRAGLRPQNPRGVPEELRRMCHVSRNADVLRGLQRLWGTVENDMKHRRETQKGWKPVRRKSQTVSKTARLGSIEPRMQARPRHQRGRHERKASPWPAATRSICLASSHPLGESLKGRREPVVPCRQGRPKEVCPPRLFIIA